MSERNDQQTHTWTQGDTTFISSTTGVRRTFLAGDLVDYTYRLTSFLGRGGMGIVFGCRHETLGSDYAVKLLDGEQLNSEYWSRFQTEAKALAKLNHPNIIRVHNMGIDAGQYPYYVMDLLSGEDLDMLIRQNGALPVKTALDYFIQVSDALISAHAQGIIHRDIKPSNLMPVRDSQNNITGIKLVDFGIARLSKQSHGVQSQTVPGMIFGTPFYMSPEQSQGLSVDERSDIYSLGCALFACLTGRPPFRGDSALHTMMLHQNAAPPSLVSVAPAGEYPQSLQSALDKMLAKAVSERYQTMAQVKHDLERIRAGKPVMPQGLVITTDQDKYGSALDLGDQSKKIAGDKGEVSKAGNEHRGSSTIKIVMIAGSVLLVLAATWFGLRIALEKPAALPKSTNIFDLGEEHGALAGRGTGENIPVAKFLEDADQAEPIVNQYITRSDKNPSLFKQGGDKPGFQFPDHFIMGAIKIGSDAPQMATGFVAAPPGLPARMYLNYLCRTWPEVLDKFGADNLSGLEIVAENPDPVINKLSKWGKLRELSFFNYLTRSPYGTAAFYSESILKPGNLQLINKMVHLRSLGLCGSGVTGGAILQMTLLNTIKTLKIMHISELGNLLEGLPAKKNITELWLILGDHEETSLKPIAKMESLQTLHIRSFKFSVKEIESFQGMRQLKHLIISQQWEEGESEKFKRALPAFLAEKFEAEPYVDPTYWKLLPDKK